jgi:invasion protein IalB
MASIAHHRSGLAGIALALLGAWVARPADAQSNHRDWRVYTVGSGNNKVCYAVSPATSASPSSANRSGAFSYVAVWADNPRVAVPSFRVASPLRDAPRPRAIVGRRSFELYAAGVEAFSRDAGDAPLAREIAAGSALRFEAAAEDGTRQTFEFSLRGSADAIDAARAACR